MEHICRARNIPGMIDGQRCRVGLIVELEFHNDYEILVIDSNC